MTSDRAEPGADRGPPAPPFVLLDDSLTAGGRAFLYEDPAEIIACHEPATAAAALERLGAAGEHGLHAAGFLAYELGYLLEPRLARLLPRERAQPLLWFGLFAQRRELDDAEVDALLGTRGRAPGAIANLGTSLDRAGYLERVRRVQEYIGAGDVYQINLTFKLRFDYSGDPLTLYAELRRRQRVAHGALLCAPEFQVLSLSPELFLSIEDGRALAKPMKGTAARGGTAEEDAALRDWLRADEKSRAENLMIVDLLRNDLSRVAEIGTVEVPELFSVETYPTVHQMISSVTARLRPGMRAPDLVRALFPCGSITGAPKLRAMEIIRELEPAPRGVYTGAIGAIAPDGGLRFNVAIRTLVLDGRGRGEMGIGSGIVYDSDPEAEYRECLLKARFLTRAEAPLRLIETLRWTREDGYYLLSAHLDRLARSAAHFGYPCDAHAVRRALEAAVVGRGDAVLRVRLLLDTNGGAEVMATPIALPGADAVWRYAVSDRRVDPGDPLLCHKTTRRALYDGESARLQAATGCDDVLFLNTRGEVTEASRSNLFIARAGRLLTPPLACGLLPGTLRRALLEDPTVAIEERVLTLKDLATAEAVYLGNSVRGLVRARPVAAETEAAMEDTAW